MRPSLRADVPAVAVRPSLFRGLAERLRRPVAGGSYSPEIDGLRFIAIAIVVVGHFWERAVRFFPVAQDQLATTPLGGVLLRPGMGVYLFFAVSGFILARQAMKVSASPLSGPFLKAYFGRRILRIEPPYVILLVATWLLITVSGYAPAQTNHFDTVPHSLEASLAGSLLYVHDLVWGTYPRLFPPGWSLEIEVQFYLLAPILFWLFLKTRPGAPRLILGALGLAASAFVSIVAPSQVGPVYTSTSILQFFHFFWLGILIAHARPWITDRIAAVPPLLAGLIGWGGLVCYLALPNTPKDLAGALAFRAVTLLAAFAMFASAFAPGSSFRAFCGRPWIAVIGGACYSIYLTHLQVIQVTTGLLAKLAPQAGVVRVFGFLAVEVMIVTVAGLVFYALIERTFMLKDWPQRFRGALASLMRKLRIAEPFGSQVVAGRSNMSREPR